MREVERLIQEEKAKILGETAKIAWRELEKFYAQGKLILVDDSLNLINTGYAISLDDATKIIEWMEEGLLKKQFDEEAKLWHEQDTQVWSVVIHPWILVQAIRN